MQSKKLNFLIGTCLLVVFASCSYQVECDDSEAKELVLEHYEENLMAAMIVINNEQIF